MSSPSATERYEFVPATATKIASFLNSRAKTLAASMLEMARLLLLSPSSMACLAVARSEPGLIKATSPDSTNTLEERDSSDAMPSWSSSSVASIASSSTRSLMDSNAPDAAAILQYASTASL